MVIMYWLSHTGQGPFRYRASKVRAAVDSGSIPSLGLVHSLSIGIALPAIPSLSVYRLSFYFLRVKFLSF